ncbi:hypothetical protein KR222_005230 [Zaprionus bogoriensis]|nr:hypothetical protein KR222_005230 [Zaprionus bogoriensis]
MWLSLVLVGLLPLLGAEQALPSYDGCFDYCQANCQDKGQVECVYQCNDGCGCNPALLQWNNGGHRKIYNCERDDKTDEDVDAPLPDGPRHPNGDYVLNLLEFVPLSPTV